MFLHELQQKELFEYTFNVLYFAAIFVIPVGYVLGRFIWFLLERFLNFSADLVNFLLTKRQKATEA